MKKNHKSIWILVTLLFYLILCFIRSKEMIQSFLDYSLLFFQKLFPVSFMMFLFSSLLIRYQLLEILSQIFFIRTTKVYVFFASLLSGFPSGAKYTKELWEQGKITTEEANHMLLFSHFPNPLFVLGSISSLLEEKRFLFLLFLSIGISNFLLLILRKEKRKEISQEISFPKNFSKELTESILSAIHTLMIIYGISVFFYIFASIVTYYVSFSSSSFLFLNGLLDLTKGIFSTSILENSIEKTYWILGFLSFGSLSIHMQVKSILEDTPISYVSFLKGRVIGTILSFLIFTLFH